MLRGADTCAGTLEKVSTSNLTPPPSRAVLDRATGLADRIEDDEVRRAMKLACWHLRGAIERLEQRAAATVNADERVAKAEVAAARRVDSLASAEINGMDPHGHFVYLLWGDVADRPLYVGLSSNVLGRLGDHMRSKSRRDSIRRVTILRCPSRSKMISLERSLIARHQPPWNVQGIVDERSPVEIASDLRMT